MFTHPDNNWVYDGTSSLKDHTLLAINGYSYTNELDQYIEQNRNNSKRISLLSGEGTLERALNMLAINRIDIVVEDDFVMAWATRSNDNISRPRNAGQLKETLTYVAFSPALENSGELARILSEGTERLIKSGRVDAILENYGISGHRGMQ